jgi:hypothetical protein
LKLCQELRVLDRPPGLLGRHLHGRLVFLLLFAQFALVVL